VAEPFNGSWSINLEKSRVWDTDNQTWVSPDPIGREDLTFFIDGDTYDQTIVVGTNPIHHMSYSAKWDGDWVPYMCRRIEIPEDVAPTPHPRMELGPYTPFEPNKPTAWIKMIKISSTFHYRISRNVDWTNPGYVMSRSMNPDEMSFRSTVLSPGGEAVIVRIFERVE
jgi:hypothetical protein